MQQLPLLGPLKQVAGASIVDNGLEPRDATPKGDKQEYNGTCIYIHMNIHIYVYIYTYAYTHIYIHMNSTYVGVSIYIYMYTQICLYTHMLQGPAARSAQVAYETWYSMLASNTPRGNLNNRHMCISRHVFMSMHAYVHAYVDICVHTYTTWLLYMTFWASYREWGAAGRLQSPHVSNKCSWLQHAACACHASDHRLQL